MKDKKNLQLYLAAAERLAAQQGIVESHSTAAIHHFVLPDLTVPGKVVFVDLCEYIPVF